MKQLVSFFPVVGAQDSRNIRLAEGNIKSLLFGKAANKLQTDLKTMAYPFTVMDNGKSRYNRTQKYSTEFCSTAWANFKFDKQAILNCL